MRILPFIIVSLCLGTLPVMAAPADCKLRKLAELPIEIRHSHIFVSGRINDRPARIMLDTGAWKTVMSPQFAHKLGLSGGTLANTYSEGIGGRAAVGYVQVDTMAIGDWQAEKIGVTVVEDTHMDQFYDLVMGRDIFNEADVELDYAHNAVRLFQPQQCDDVPLAYWAQTYAESPLRTLPGHLSPDVVRVSINGVDTWALLDTGAGETLLDRRVAGRAGVHADSPGSVAGVDTAGIGQRTVSTYVGTFDSVAVGDETIRNVRLAVGEWGDHDGNDDERMILGTDFIRSHRIMIARDQHKIYFTNVSQPVFTPHEKKKNAG